MNTANQPVDFESAAPAALPAWTGVVMIERPDLTKTPHVSFSNGPLCLVRSARTIALNGGRAVVCKLPYAMVEKFFRAGEADHCFVWAEIHPNGDSNHLELCERASLKDWVDHAAPSTTH